MYSIHSTYGDYLGAHTVCMQAAWEVVIRYTSHRVIRGILCYVLHCLYACALNRGQMMTVLHTVCSQDTLFTTDMQLLGDSSV